MFLCSLLIATGCARYDQIVEVEPRYLIGRWAGTWSGSGLAGKFEMTLEQIGPTRVRGYFRLPGEDDQPIEGVISHGGHGRDVFNFWTRDGQLRGELRVAGDEMSGTGTWWMGTKTLRLQPQP